MCTNGVNAGQLQSSIAMLDDHIALVRRWTHKTYHLADDAQMARTADKLQAVQNLLDEARALLDETVDALERDGRAQDNTTVELV